MFGSSDDLDALNKYMGFNVVRGLHKGGRSYACVLVQHHRAALPALWAARQSGILSEIPYVLRLDAHPDCANEFQLEYERFGDLKSIREVMAFANALHEDNGGYVEAVIKFNWVRDVVTIFNKQWHDKPVRDIQDIYGADHRVVSVGSFAEISAGTGANDQSAVDFAKNMLSTCLSESDLKAPLWIDIDLDFAVSSGVIWTPERFCTEFETIVHPFNRSLKAILERAFRHASLVTIATEFKHSGGLRGAAYILDQLQSLFGASCKWFSWDQEEWYRSFAKE